MGADAVCGADYVWEQHKNTMACQFYDSWVAHDMTGTNIVSVKTEPFQAFSCWNGVVTFSADIFHSLQLKFRRSNRLLGECAASESELIFHDMWKLGRGRVVVNPSVAVAYDAADWGVCARRQQPKFFVHGQITFDPAPRELTCC